MRIRLLLALLIALAVANVLPLASAPADPATASRPKLVVLLVVDQMRADYVLKYGHQWKGGLRRLMDEGAWFQQAMYPYSYTVTCVGHATISTGSFPRTHGIVGNSWFDRDSKSVVECDDDPAQKTISYGGPINGARGPNRLATATLTDHLRAQLPTAPRIVTMSMKERTAIMLAGHRADAVTWFDASVASFATTTAYTRQPVPFVEAYVKAHPIDNDVRTPWNLAAPAATYAYTDDAVGERPPAYWSRTFPHPLDVKGANKAVSASAWESSPASDAYLARLGEASIDALHLGQGPGTDFLGISFSALDLVGHSFGPQSYEVQDVLVRLDAAIGSLLAHLDRTVGRANYVVALSGDHGVSPIPEQLVSEGIQAGRLPSSAYAERIEQMLQPAMAASGKAIASTLGGHIYLAPAAAAAVARDPQLRDAIRAEIERVPGVARVLFAAERDSWANGDTLAKATGFSYFPGRGPDVILQTQPYWLFGSALGSPASHGTPYRYDAWVPLFFYGSGIKAGRYVQSVTPADLAPTLAFLCGVTLPHADGRPLLEAVDATARRPTTKPTTVGTR